MTVALENSTFASRKSGDKSPVASEVQPAEAEEKAVEAAENKSVSPRRTSRKRSDG